MTASPSVPLPTATGWLARLDRLADDVDLGLPPRATANAIRAIVADMYPTHQRATASASINIAGVAQERAFPASSVVAD